MARVPATASASRASAPRRVARASRRSAPPTSGRSTRGSTATTRSSRCRTTRRSTPAITYSSDGRRVVLPALGRAPPLELLARLRRRRIDAEDRATFAHLLLHEILVGSLLEALLRHRVREVLRDD